MTRIRLSDLQTGDEIHVYMRVGLALEVGIRPDRTPYRYVPSRPQKASCRALARFQGLVTSNDPDSRIIHLQVIGINHKKTPLSSDIAMAAEISYTSFDRVQLLSPVNYAPSTEMRRGGNYFRPTATEGIGNGFRPYRTLENVQLIYSEDST